MHARGSQPLPTGEVHLGSLVASDIQSPHRKHHSYIRGQCHVRGIIGDDKDIVPAPEGDSNHLNCVNINSHSTSCYFILDYNDELILCP